MSTFTGSRKPKNACPKCGRHVSASKANKPYSHYVDGHFEHIDCSDTPYLRDLEHRRAVYVATIRGEFQGKT